MGNIFGITLLKGHKCEMLGILVSCLIRGSIGIVESVAIAASSKNTLNIFQHDGTIDSLLDSAKYKRFLKFLEKEQVFSVVGSYRRKSNLHIKSGVENIIEYHNNTVCLIKEPPTLSNGVLASILDTGFDNPECSWTNVFEDTSLNRPSMESYFALNAKNPSVLTVCHTKMSELHMYLYPVYGIVLMSSAITPITNIERTIAIGKQELLGVPVGTATMFCMNTNIQKNFDFKKAK